MNEWGLVTLELRGNSLLTYPSFAVIILRWKCSLAALALHCGLAMRFLLSNQDADSGLAVTLQGDGRFFFERNRRDWEGRPQDGKDGCWMTDQVRVFDGTMQRRIEGWLDRGTSSYRP